MNNVGDIHTEDLKELEIFARKCGWMVLCQNSSPYDECKVKYSIEEKPELYCCKWIRKHNTSLMHHRDHFIKNRARTMASMLNV